MTETAFRGPRAPKVGMLALGLALNVLVPSRAGADVVDDAYVSGGEAAGRGDWDDAIVHYEEARRLLPGRSAVLDHDLGVAYGNAGKIGLAIFHLRLALGAEPGDDVSESARRSLGILRRRAEFAAAASGAQISPPAGWLDLVVSGLAATSVAWVTAVSGWLWLLVLGLRWLATAGKIRRSRVSRPVVWLFGWVFVVGGAVHWVAEDAERFGARAIVLEDSVEVREGPGSHRTVQFDLQGGSRVRVVEESGAWSKVRVPGGLRGWVSRSALGHLAQP